MDREVRDLKYAIQLWRANPDLRKKAYPASIKRKAVGAVSVPRLDSLELCKNH